MASSFKDFFRNVPTQNIEKTVEKGEIHSFFSGNNRYANNQDGDDES